jgi:hypothetical protein
MAAQFVMEELQVTEERAGGMSAKRRRGRDAFVFLAGAEAFHTLSHVWLGLSGMLPMEIQFPSITLTPGLNLFAIVVNVLITAGLLYWAKRLTK